MDKQQLADKIYTEFEYEKPLRVSEKRTIYAKTCVSKELAGAMAEYIFSLKI